MGCLVLLPESTCTAPASGCKLKGAALPRRSYLELRHDDWSFHKRSTPEQACARMQNSKILGCVIGNNSYVGDGCLLEKSLVLGNDYYTNEKTRAASLEKGESALGIGMCPACLRGIQFCLLTYSFLREMAADRLLPKAAASRACFIVQVA